MQARKRSRTGRAMVRRASDPWKHLKAEIAFREINDGRRSFNMPLFTREDMPPGVLFDRLKIELCSSSPVDQWLDITATNSLICEQARVICVR